MRIERTGGMVDGKPVYHLVAYAALRWDWWRETPLVALRCYPKQVAQWIHGKANKHERAEVRAALGKLREQEPEDDGK